MPRKVNEPKVPSHYPKVTASNSEAHFKPWKPAADRNIGGNSRLFQVTLGIVLCETEKNGDLRVKRTAEKAVAPKIRHDSGVK